MSIVRVEAVSKNFEGNEAVSQVSFSVAEGTILGLVGSDGAGKTTLLRMIATMLKPTAGRICIKDLDVVREKTAVKPLIGYMPQRFGLYQDLTVDENINFFMDIFGITGNERRSRKDFYLGFSNLHPFVDRLARDLSGGMKQKLGLACVLVHEPAVLILDEPTNGVDPVSRQEFWDILTQMRKEGMTILVSTAYLDEGEKCDRLMLMHNAHLLAEAPPQDLRSNFPDLETAMIHRIRAVDKALADERFTP
ncbi:MAG: ABC transporter ATP-binding protein [Thermodesulfobacteriota bacterium]